jgi:hypothetical protein
MSKALLSTLGFESDVYYDLGPCRDNEDVHMWRHVESLAIVADPVVLAPASAATQKSDMQPIDDKRRAAMIALEWKHDDLPIIDCGCGYGGFALEMAKRDKLVVGYDPGAQWHGCKSIDEIVDRVRSGGSGKPKANVTMFHVLEHMADPIAELHKITSAVDVQRWCIEVPSAHDPMIEFGPYRKFVFRSDHYCGHSLQTLWELLDQHTTMAEWEIVPEQRYTLGNALNWVTKHRPTGMSEPIARGFRAMGAQTSTDTLIAWGT